MPSYKTKAIVLKSYNLGEADKILKLFSSENGLVDAVAKGARKIKSRFGGRLEVFNFLELELSKGRNLDIICQAELIKNFCRIPQDFNSFLFSQYICEIVLKTHFSQTDITPAIFKLLFICLNKINSFAKKNDANLEKIIVFFIAKFLKITGCPPLINACCVCGIEVKDGFIINEYENEPKRGPEKASYICLNGKKQSVHLDKYLYRNNSFYFSIRLGGIICHNCEPAIKNSPDIKKKITPEIYGFLKTLSYSGMKDYMEKAVPDSDVKEVFKILEDYLKYHYDLNINTSTYLKNII